MKELEKQIVRYEEEKIEAILLILRSGE